jgi:hypothetical protein
MVDNKKKKAVTKKIKLAKKTGSSDGDLLLSMEEQRDIDNSAAVTRGNKLANKNSKKIRSIMVDTKKKKAVMNKKKSAQLTGSGDGDLLLSMVEQRDINNSAAVISGNKLANKTNKKMIKIRGSCWILLGQTETDHRKERQRTIIDLGRRKRNTRFCLQRCCL